MGDMCEALGTPILRSSNVIDPYHVLGITSRNITGQFFARRHCELGNRLFPFLEAWFNTADEAGL